MMEPQNKSFELLRPEDFERRYPSETENASFSRGNDGSSQSKNPRPKFKLSGAARRKRKAARQAALAAETGGTFQPQIQIERGSRIYSNIQPKREVEWVTREETAAQPVPIRATTTQSGPSRDTLAQQTLQTYSFIQAMEQLQRATREATAAQPGLSCAMTTGTAAQSCPNRVTTAEQYSSRDRFAPPDPIPVWIDQQGPNRAWLAQPDSTSARITQPDPTRSRIIQSDPTRDRIAQSDPTRDRIGNMYVFSI